MTILFNEIPTDTRVPGQYIEIDNSMAIRGLPGLEHRIAVIGQKLSSGTAAANTQVRITDPQAAIGFFGRGSMITQMLEKIRGVNNVQEVVAIALEDNPAGAASTGSITFGGSDIKSGTLNLLIGGRRVQVGTAAGDTPAEIATAAVEAFTNSLDLGVTAEVNGSNTAQVDITSRHKGEAGNSITLMANYHDGEYTPDGLTVTFAAMSGGSGNPDMSTALAAIDEDWFTQYVMPYTDAANIIVLKDFLENNFTGLIMKDSMAWGARNGTHAELITYGGARNCPLISISGLKNPPNPTWERAAVRAGVGAYRIGIHPGRPLQWLDMKGLLPPKPEDRFTWLERQLLLQNGISTETSVGSVLKFERAITTYQVNGQGLADVSYLNVNTMALIAFIRWSERVRISQRFPNSGLRDDSPNEVTGNEIATPNKIYNELVALASELHDQGIIENLEAYKSALLVERDANDRDRVNALNPYDLVNQLRVYASKLQFIL